LRRLKKDRRAMVRMSTPLKVWDLDKIFLPSFPSPQCLQVLIKAKIMKLEGTRIEQE
jgi:hypothetical protein